MKRPKALRVDWLVEAWRIGEALELLPDRPYNAFVAMANPDDKKMAGLRDFKNSPVAAEVRAAIVALQETIRLDALRIWSNKEKYEIAGDDLDRISGLLKRRTRIATMKAARHCELVCPATGATRTFHILAHMWLSKVHGDCYISRKAVWKPVLVVASIGGTFTTQNAIGANSMTPREKGSRSSTLKLAVADARRSDPFATAAEVLDRLCPGDTVKEAKDGRVFYWNRSGDLVSVGLDRYENIFSEVKPSTG